MSNDALQLVDEISPASKEVDEWVLEIRARLDNPDISHPTRPIDSDSDSDSDSEEPSIFGNWQCWDDFGVSFLPETKKWQYVAFMERWFDLNIHSYLEEFQKKEDEVWSYYRGVDEQFRAENGKGFIEHLLVNSCILILAMVYIAKNQNLIETLDAKLSKSNNPKDRWYVDFYNLSDLFRIGEPMWIQRHMFTMDYQIPWFVVEAIYTKHSNLSKLFDTPIHKLALSCLNDIYPGMHKSKVDDDTIILPPGGFKHLLHIFHWSRSPQGKFQLNFASWPSKRMYNFYIPSATDLQLSETIFKKHPDGSIDVSYSDRRLSGVMQLAPLHLYHTALNSMKAF